MPRHFTATALISAAATLAFASAPPAFAQDADERVNQLIIYGDDPCPASDEGDITVCARKPESERFRIPEPLRETAGSLQQNEAWNNKVLAYETVGRTGTQSCSPVGAGGWTGCATRLIDQAYAERAQASDVRFSELIQEERERRLATIDADAAATQARVEEAERAYESRQRAAQDPIFPDAEQSGPTSDPALLPTEVPAGS